MEKGKLNPQAVPPICALLLPCTLERQLHSRECCKMKMEEGKEGDQQRERSTPGEHGRPNEKSRCQHFLTTATEGGRQGADGKGGGRASSSVAVARGRHLGGVGGLGHGGKATKAEKRKKLRRHQPLKQRKTKSINMSGSPFSTNRPRHFEARQIYP